MFDTLQQTHVMCHNEQMIRTAGWNKSLRKRRIKIEVILSCNKAKAVKVYKSNLETDFCFINTDDLFIPTNAIKAQVQCWRCRQC